LSKEVIYFAKHQQSDLRVFLGQNKSARNLTMDYGGWCVDPGFKKELDWWRETER